MALLMSGDRCHCQILSSIAMLVVCETLVLDACVKLLSLIGILASS